MNRWNVKVTNVLTRMSDEYLRKHLGNLERLKFNKPKKRRAKRKKV